MRTKEDPCIYSRMTMPRQKISWIWAHQPLNKKNKLFGMKKTKYLNSIRNFFLQIDI